MYFSGGKVNISPTTPCQMGCGPTNTYLIECQNPLEANFLILGEKKYERILLVSIDLLYVGGILENKIKDGLSGTYRKKNVFIFASHTHYAPMTDPDKPKLGLVNYEYIDDIADKIIKAVLNQTPKKLTNPSLSHSKYDSMQTISRRKKRIIGLKNKRIVFNTVLIGPDNKKEVNSTSNIFSISENGKVVGVIWQYSCHPTSLSFKDKFDPHFVGEIRKRLRSSEGLEVPFVFMQGFSGDLRPPSQINKPKNIYQFLRKIIFGSWFVDFNTSQYLTWIDRVSIEFFESYKQTTQNTVYIENLKLNTRMIEVPLREFAHSMDEFKKKILVFHYLGFILRGKDFTRNVKEMKVDFVGVSAEVVSHYQLELSKFKVGEILVGFGCLGDVFGYLPTKRMIEDGGYESIDYLPYFGLDFLQPDIEAKTLAYFEKLVRP